MGEEIIIGDPIVNPVIDPAVDDVIDPMNVTIPMDGDTGCNELTPVTDTSTTLCQYFGTLQESITISWRYHLKTRKHHIHIALNEFYEKALDIVDDIIEQYQGLNGVIDEMFVNTIFADGKTEVEYLRELRIFTDDNRNLVGGFKEIDSTIDDFVSLIDSTLYKIYAFNENKIKTYDEFCFENLTEAVKYDRYGERHSDDPDDDDYNPDYDNVEEE